MISFFFSSRRRHTRSTRDWSSDVCSSDLTPPGGLATELRIRPRYHRVCWLRREVDIEHRSPPFEERPMAHLLLSSIQWCCPHTAPAQSSGRQGRREHSTESLPP